MTDHSASSPRRHRRRPPRQHPTTTITALGGLGEIGRNCLMLTTGTETLVIDAGVLFPDHDQPGVDVILPDFSHLPATVDAVVLTHGHEDHIGGLPYLLAEHSVAAVYGTQLTLELVKRKLDERHISVNLIPICGGDTVTVGTSTLTFVDVNHSIPDAVAVFVSTPAGTVLATGDFKMDPFPRSGVVTNLAAFARFGTDPGVDVFAVDSTNAEVAGFTISEQDLLPAIDSVFATSAAAIVVSTFASHFDRIQAVIDAAVTHGRRVVFHGRTMVNNVTLAQRLGRIRIPDGTQVDARTARTLPRGALVHVVTGSQGEPNAALSRAAAGTHRDVSIHAGDTVLLASSVVPGNETAISRLINAMSDAGARVVHKGNALVHTSGHACAAELALCYTIVKPRHVLPVHGEPRHLEANAAIAARAGVADGNVLRARNGSVVTLTSGRARVTGTVAVRPVLVERGGVSCPDDLATRQVMAVDGHVSVLVHSAGSQRWCDQVQVSGMSVDPEFTSALVTAVTAAVTDAAPQQVTRAATACATRLLRKHAGRDPSISVFYTDLDDRGGPAAGVDAAAV